MGTTVKLKTHRGDSIRYEDGVWYVNDKPVSNEEAQRVMKL